MTAPVVLSDADVLRATAAYFEADPTRWAEGLYFNRKTGCRCVLGGIACAVDPDDTDGDPALLPMEDGSRATALAAVTAFEAYLADELCFEALNPHEPLVGEWNDLQPDAATVIGTLRAAADWAETRREVAS